jgi:hypothetical protein
MTNDKLTELLKIAYRWGRDNGEGRSEKNFNDLLQTEAISQALRIHDVAGRSEHLRTRKELDEGWENLKNSGLDKPLDKIE